VLKSLEWRVPEKVSFSPDGRYIAYDMRPRQDSPDRDIFIISTDGRQEVPLVKNPAIDYDAVWTPDGGRILFASDRRGTTGLWTIRVADGKPQGAPELLKPDMGAVRSMGFSREGAYFYGVRTPTEDVYVVDLDPQTGELSSTPTRLTERYLGSNLGAVWSPDGRKLAYFSRRGPTLVGPGNMAVVIRSLDTGEEREFFSNLEFNRRAPIARWFPDGQSLLLSTQDNQGRGSLHRMDAQTGTVTPLLQALSASGRDTVPCISPDGQTIYYFRSAEGSENWSVMAHELATGRERELWRSASPSGGRSLALAVSRDGKRLAFGFSNIPSGIRSLKVLPVGGGEAREIFRTEPGSEQLLVAASGIDWTRDDRFILFVRNRITEGGTDIWRVAPDGSAAGKILTGEGFEALLLPDVHPAGRRLVFTAGQREKNEVWVLENFLPGLK
jgi:Tol biopolymer transport system component